MSNKKSKGKSRDEKSIGEVTFKWIINDMSFWTGPDGKTKFEMIDEMRGRLKRRLPQRERR